MNNNFLTEDRVTALIKMMPNSEEVGIVENYEGDPDALGLCEKFFQVMSSIPSSPKRLQLIYLKLQFKDQITDLEMKLSYCTMSLNVLKTSKSLRKILSLVLALGNYLNAENRKGGAFGFEITTLNKLKNTKGNDKSTLLDFLVDLVQTKYPEARNFLDEFNQSGLEKASKIEITWLTGQTGKLLNGLKQVKLALNNPDSRDESVDQFVPVMTVFHTTATKKIGPLKKNLGKLEAEVKEVMKMFGTNSSKFTMQELFSLFVEFVNDWKNAETKQKKKEEEEKKKR